MRYNFRNGIIFSHTNIYKRCQMHFCASYHRFHEIKVSNSYIKQVIQGHGGKISQWNMAYIKIYNSYF